MTINPERVQEALAEARELVQADGGDLTLSAIDSDGRVTLDLVLADAACAECVLPTEMLERMITSMMRAAEPAISAVTVNDPRSG